MIIAFWCFAASRIQTGSHSSIASPHETISTRCI
jgi:hypothetical protein